MFEKKQIKKQNKSGFTSGRSEKGGSSFAGTRTTNPSYFIQRYLGNSHFQLSGDAPTIQRKCSCGGACGSCSGKEEEISGIQPKLTVGSPNDVYEQEADRVAEQVMRMPDSPFQTEAEHSNNGINIRRISTVGGDSQGFDADINLNQSGGHRLSSSTRNFMEPRFGVDFSDVRLHTDSESQKTASEINARAFTYGNHIWMGRGADESDKGLMAHELTHVVQQGAAGRNNEFVNRMSLSPRIQRTPTANQCPGGTKTVTVDLVSLNGSTRNAPDDLDFANTIFRPCCVQFALGRGLSVEPTLSDTWLGGDTDLQVGTCGSPSTEELNTFNGATARFGLTSRIRAFYVATISSGNRGDSYPPYCATGTAAPLQGMLDATNGGGRRTLAHEIGHILLNSASHTGIENPADTSNLMVPTNTATGETLDPTQCATIFANA